MLKGLADQHPVEGVSVQGRQLVQVKHGALVERQHGNPVLVPLFGHEPFEGSRQRQLTKRMFGGKLPDRHGAQQDVIGGIGKDPCGRRRQFLRA